MTVREREFQTEGTTRAKVRNKQPSRRARAFTARKVSREALQLNFKLGAFQGSGINNLVGHEVWKGYLKS